ncbi:MAG TPA: hypothetical protein VNL71_16260 [Chloroflexota bacterium]|nr:hypothetical protein [Chloroflexota bacterium]
MPRTLPRQSGGFDSHESIIGDAVPLNGLEDQSARRAHMREQTTARQAAERRLEFPRIRRAEYDYHARMAARAGEVRAELALIDVAHEAWLRAHGGEVEETLPNPLIEW